MTHTSPDPLTDETSPQSQQKTSPTTTCSSEACHASPSVAPEDTADLRTPGEPSSSILPVSLIVANPAISLSRTSQDYSVTTLAGLSRQSLGYLPTLGIECNGKYYVRQTSACPRTATASTWSRILAPKPDLRYFLSSEQSARIMSLAAMSNQQRKSSLRPATLEGMDT